MEEKDDIITIDFSALLKILWKEKIWIILITFLFTAAGAFYAFKAREEFVSEGRILPEVSSGAGSSLGGLANLIGVGGFEMGLKNNTDAIRPDLYPDILKTTDFFNHLFQKEVQTKNGVKLNFEKYYHQEIEDSKVFKEKYLTLPKANPEGVVIMNRKFEDRIEDLKQRINASIDKKTGVISISAKMPDPVVAAMVAKYGIDFMTEYVISYRTEKLRKEVEFLGQKVAASRGKFYATQEKKAQYTDQFQAPTIRLQAADVNRERIESEYRISSSFYNELLKKYEETKIKLQQETPVFQIAQAPRVPNLKSEPKKFILILSFSILGGTISLLFLIFYKKNYKYFLK